MTRTFTYNPAGQIASLTSSNDAYARTDAVDVYRTYIANGLNQYTVAGAVTLDYDATSPSAGPIATHTPRLT